jgi:DNA-binding LytR/AlgR family response regulator
VFFTGNCPGAIVQLLLGSNGVCVVPTCNRTLSMTKGLLDPRPVVLMLADDPMQAMAGSDAGVCDLLMLPFDEARFMLALDRCVATVLHSRQPQQNGNGQRALVVPGIRRSLHLPMHTIGMVKAQGNQVLVYGDGQATKVNCTMKRIEELMEGQPFVRVHRSYIVALREVRDMDQRKVYTSFGEVPIGMDYRQHVKEFMRGR